MYMFRRIVILCFGCIAIISILVYCNTHLYRSNYEEVGVIAAGYITEIDVAFLSDEYFFELNGLFEKVMNEKIDRYNKSMMERAAATVVLNKMMNDLEGDTEALETHDNKMRYFETFDNHIRTLDQITERMHYFRNILNTYSDAPVKLEDMIDLAANGQWHLFSAEYHLFFYGDLNGALNVKFISDDGRFEAVYNTETGEIVTDPANMGTYNYAPGAFDLLKFINHTIYDKEPWKRWGNVEGFAYEDIMKLESGRGTDEARENNLEVEMLIEKMQIEIVN